MSKMRRDVLRKLGEAKALLSSYIRIRETAADPEASPELANTKADLETILDDLADLDDLDDSVTAVESDPSHFGISVEEVRRRRGFVEQVKDQVEELRHSATSTYSSRVCLTGALSNCSLYHLDLCIRKVTRPDQQTMTRNSTNRLSFTNRTSS
jgi:hypothetical protein